MPLYYFECKKCNRQLRKILPGRVGKGLPHCPECGVNMERLHKPPTTQVLETLDNSLMPKKVERLANAEQLYKDRSKNHRK